MQFNLKIKAFFYKNRSKLLKSLLLLFVFIVCSFVLLFLFRNSLLNHYKDKYSQRYSEKFKVDINIKKAEFKGVKTVLLNELFIVDRQQADTLLSISKIEATISLWDLLKTHIRFLSLSVDSTSLNLIKKSNEDNFSFLLKNGETKNNQKQQGMDYALAANNLLTLFFDVIPKNLKLNSFNIKLTTDSILYDLTVPKAEVTNGVFYSQFSIKENNDQSVWKINGSINEKNNEAQFKLIKNDSLSYFPLVNAYNLKTTADTILVSLKGFDYQNNQLYLKGNAKLSNFEANHWRISSKNVVLNNSFVDYNITVGKNFIQLDSTSLVRLNKIDLKPFFKIDFNPSKKVTFNINIPKMSSQYFFESLPQGLFTNLDGIKTKGELEYHLRFMMDTQTPDSLVFSSTLTPYQFKIQAFGETNLSKLNDEFSYTVFENNRLFRTFLVGPSNPNYTPIENISTYLKETILSSEDGNFYNHKGFNEFRFKESIAENFKKKRFARGASTISMQLIKNVFLRRNKTIARKIEEALLVWLIERNRLVSKERMFEVYLNVIEFGPNVYGIGEASKFYFNKSPKDLTLQESIFISMIIPRPKWFMYNFNSDGQLKESTQSYFNLIGGILARKGSISVEEQQSITNQIMLSPQAQGYLIKQDTASIESLELQEELNNME